MHMDNVRPEVAHDGSRSIDERMIVPRLLERAREQIVRHLEDTRTLVIALLNGQVSARDVLDRCEHRDVVATRAQERHRPGCERLDARRPVRWVPVSDDEDSQGRLSRSSSPHP